MRAVTEPVQGQGSSIGGPATFALVLLTAANLLNYLDRQILSILAQSIKADLKLDDAQLGFLMGTAFAVFYAIVGIAMGRIADRLSRRKLMAFGLTLWSVMTSLSGAATSFVGLSAARIGVGVGEATANPCGHALLSDIFPPRNRAFALAVMLSGVYLGSALAMIVGGVFIQHWGDMCSAVPIAGACSIAAWKAALIAVGIPGLPLAALLLLVREPPREIRGSASAVRDVAAEIAATIPPLTVLTVQRLGGAPAATRNVVTACIMALVAALIGYATGDWPQWIAAGLGAYAIYTWGQVQRIRDRPLYAVTFGDHTFLYLTIGSAALACVGGAVNVWAAPYAMRSFGLSPVQLGATLGLLQPVTAVLSVIFGGLLADRWKRTDLRAPVWVALISLVGELPFMFGMMVATSSTLFFACFAGFCLFTSMWAGAFAALVQDLVLPRMRGAAAAAFSLVSVVLSSSIGPYWAGKVSALTGSLSAGLLSLVVFVPIVLVGFGLALKRMPQETPERRRMIAEAAGEAMV